MAATSRPVAPGPPNKLCASSFRGCIQRTWAKKNPQKPKTLVCVVSQNVSPSLSPHLFSYSVLSHDYSSVYSILLYYRCCITELHAAVTIAFSNTVRSERIPVPVVWMPACCADRLGRLGYRAMWLLGVASWHLQRTAVVRPSSFEVENGSTMRRRRRRVAQHPNNGDNDGGKAIRVVDAVPSVDHLGDATSTEHVPRWPKRTTRSWSGRRSAPRSGRYRAAWSAGRRSRPCR